MEQHIGCQNEQKNIYLNNTNIKHTRQVNVTWNPCSLDLDLSVQLKSYRIVLEYRKGKFTLIDSFISFLPTLTHFRFYYCLLHFLSPQNPRRSSNQSTNNLFILFSVLTLSFLLPPSQLFFVITSFCHLVPFYSLRIRTGKNRFYFICSFSSFSFFSCADIITN